MINFPVTKLNKIPIKVYSYNGELYDINGIEINKSDFISYEEYEFLALKIKISYIVEEIKKIEEFNDIFLHLNESCDLCFDLTICNFEKEGDFIRFLKIQQDIGEYVKYGCESTYFINILFENNNFKKYDIFGHYIHNIKKEFSNSQVNECLKIFKRKHILKKL